MEEVAIFRQILEIEKENLFEFRERIQIVENCQFISHID